MDDGVNLINFDLTEENELRIKESIEKSFKKVLNTPFRRAFFNKRLKQSVLLVGVGFLIGFITAVIFFIISQNNMAQQIALITLVITGSILLFLAVFISTNEQISRSIRRELEKSVLDYWIIVTRNSDVKINEFTNHFTLLPDHCLGIKKNFRSEAWIERVLIGRDKKINFNIGSVAEKVISGIDERRMTIYNRHLYFTKEVKNDIVANIPVDQLKRVILERSKELSTDELIDIFGLNNHGSRELKKILTIQVMNDLYHLSKNFHPKYVPEIYLNKNKITLTLLYRNIKLESKAGDLGYLEVSSDKNEFYDNVIRMIYHDIMLINNLNLWVKVLNIE